MDFIKLNKSWNSDPNAPNLKLIENGNSIILEFYLNYFVFKNFLENDKGKLVFNNCYKYVLANCNDEGYFMEQYRYTHKELPFGEFYELKNSKNFKGKFVGKKSNKLKHYIFMTKENIFECLAEDFGFEVITN